MYIEQSTKCEHMFIQSYRVRRFRFDRLSKEWNPSSRLECLEHPHPPTCMFNDMADFFLPAVKTILPQIQENGWIENKLMPLVMNRKAATTILDDSFEQV